MLAKFTVISEIPTARRSLPVRVPVTRPGSEVAELFHLARAVLLKSPADLAAIADASPAMPGTWIEAFKAERARAEAETQFWSTAIAYLMATAPGPANDN